MRKKIKKKVEGLWKKIQEKIHNLRTVINRSWWYFFYYHIKLDENLVFVESRDGKDFTGNIFRIVEELSKDEYNDLKICVWIKKEMRPRVDELCRNYHIKKLCFVYTLNQVIPVMERAKYIVSDSGIPWEYVKRKGQIVLNTWHGTPLKVMGRKVDSEKHMIGTVQHFFFSSDFLLYPSEYMKDVMLRDYMVENVISGKALMSGYPRNSVFFDKNRSTEMKGILHLEGKKVFAYMPTYRGMAKKGQNTQQVEEIIDKLSYIDSYMHNEQVMLVKLHVFNQSKIDFSQFEHIKPFPQGYETYDVLNATDCLITDYSSVFFDYANTRNKIILFAYDEEEYFSDRGTYFPLSDMPFPCVKDMESLLREMNLPKEYDDSEFLNKFCTYDEPDAAEKLCKHVFKNQKVCKEEPLGDGKENVLIFGGSLAKNGITTALVNLLNNIDLSKRNYYVSFNRWEINADPRRVDVIPSHIDYLPLMCDTLYTFRERLCYDRYIKKRDRNAVYSKYLKKMFQRELDRCYWGAKFSYIVQFDGYGNNVTLLFMESPLPKTIFVHNDMVSELATRNVQHPLTLKNAYTNYDKVAIVHEHLWAPTVAVGAPKEKIVTVHNIYDIENIVKRGKMPIKFEKDTECWPARPSGVEAVLNSSGKKFITVGRFSKEKGHQRLLRAFDKFCDDYRDTQLIIIGGHGALYNSTIRWCKGLKHWENVTIIKSVRNPMPILMRCDLFILSSFYEGLPMVISEADCLGIPTYSTDISGLQEFMTRYDGHLVENSEKGILQGMYDYMNGLVTTLDIDYARYNEQALTEFESLFEDVVESE